jgi:hypothetical protein
MVGIQRDEAVNVCLLQPAFTFTDPVTAHGYAHEWYRWSVNLGGFTPPAAPPAIGFRRALEFAGTFPPSGTGTSAGSLWYENVGSADSLDLLHQPNPRDFEANALILGAYAVQAGARLNSALANLYGAGFSVVYQLGEATADGLLYAGREWVYEPLDATGRFVMKSYETGIEALGEVGGSIIFHTGNVVSEIGEKAGNLWDATLDHARDAANAFDPDYATTSPMLSPVFRFRLRAGNAAPAASGEQAIAASSANQPPYLWLHVNIPEKAGFMIFDFAVTGDPREDRIVCAINEVNVFSLAGKFAPAGVPSSTELIDVSAYAGQSVELFFGLTGGTAVECETVIDSIRFVTMPDPKIGIAASGVNVAVKWPAAATGWTLEATDSLTAPNWQPVSLNGVTVESGVATLEQPASGSRSFYRLRRNP